MPRFLALVSLFFLACPLIGMAGTDLPVRNAKSPMGLNVGGLADWSPELYFVDVFRTARKFAATHPDLSLDAKGWPKMLAPGQVAETFLLWDIGDAFPAGIYSVFYDGKGDISFGGGASATRKEDGRYWVSINPRKGGVHLKITRTDLADPIRNIRMIMPGGVCASNPLKRVDREQDCKDDDYASFEENYETQIFNPDYLNLLADFKVLRFMDFLRINHSGVVDWSDRGKMDDATWTTEGGGPIEIMVDLSNRLNADPWVNIPHKASDDYVRNLAVQLKKTLDPELKVYLEYSNEAWNGAFSQFRYMIEQGQRENLGGDQYQAGMRYVAKRSLQIFKTFEEVFGGTDRLVRILPGQAANAYVVESILLYEDAYKHSDAIAIAPYFGGDLGLPKAQANKLSVAELFSKLRKESLGESIEWIQQHAKLAKKYDLDMLAYEGGHHLAGVLGAENDKKLTSLFDKADDNFQMGGLYDRYFAEWKKAGGKTFAYYKSVAPKSKWGNWGLVDRLNTKEGESPKKDAVLRFIRDNPRWW